MSEGAHSTTWPNWVDLVVVIIALRSCYSGCGRGVLTESLNLLSVVTATALASNYHGLITELISPWWSGQPATLAFLVFLSVFGGGLVLFHAAIRKLTQFVQWEPYHWVFRGLGLVGGALRGLWWCGLVLVMLLSLGLPYLADSVEKRSLLASRMLPMLKQSMEQVVDWYPGHVNRTTLIPAITIQLPRLPEV